MKNRKQWFLDRVGKRVFRTTFGCDCEICQSINENGMVIENELHAIHCYDQECDVNADGVLLRYFDTKEEVAEFEKASPL